MQTQLPRRPFNELMPPPDGLEVVRRDAARRRRRRTAAVVTGGLTAAVVTTVALFVGGGVDGDAILRPAPITPATQLPGPSTVTPTGGAVTPGRVGPRVRPGVGGRASAGPAAPSARTGLADSDVGGTGARRVAAPVLTRTRSSYSGAPRVCRTADSATDSSVHAGSNWCLEETAARVDGGVRLTLVACRDSTSGGTLTFASSREVDFVVQRAGRTVWSWSHDHPGTSSRHSLTAPANGCWNWSLVWPGISSSGGDVPRGDYTLLATSTADEVYGDSPDGVPFRY